MNENIIKIYPSKKCKVCNGTGNVVKVVNLSESKPGMKSQFQKQPSPCECLIEEAKKQYKEGVISTLRLNISYDEKEGRFYAYEGGEVKETIESKS